MPPRRTFTLGTALLAIVGACNLYRPVVLVQPTCDAATAFELDPSTAQLRWTPDCRVTEIWVRFSPVDSSRGANAGWRAFDLGDRLRSPQQLGAPAPPRAGMRPGPFSPDTSYSVSIALVDAFTHRRTVIAVIDVPEG